MFQSLDEQIRNDENRVSNARERMMLYGLYALIGVIVCFAVIYGIQLMG